MTESEFFRNVPDGCRKSPVDNHLRLRVATSRRFAFERRTRDDVGEIPFTKAHGLGNDFLLVEEAALGGRSPEQISKRACDRHTGAGADGLVTLAAVTDNEWKFRIYNSDGSEAQLSGNAMRCAAAWAVSRLRAASPGQAVTLDTRVGRKRHIFRGRQGSAWIFQSEIVRPVFTPEQIPFRPPKQATEPVVRFPLPVGDQTLPVTALWMGNPQCIILVEDFGELDWLGAGREIERHPYFPDRVNVGFVRVVAPDRVEVRFWERGAGYTMASGTGSCACAVAAAMNGKTGRRVSVITELGEMQVHWREDDDVVELVGPAEIVVTGVFFLDE